MRIRLVLTLLVAAAAFTAWQAESRATQAQRVLWRSLAAQLQPFGTLEYGVIKAHFWGSGRIDDVRFKPSPVLAQQLGLPLDASARVATLHFSDWQPGAVWPTRVHLAFDAATLELAAPWPQSYQGHIDWQYQEPSRELHLGWTLNAPAAAALKGALALRLASATSLAGVTLLGGHAEYRDQGLAQGERAGLAARLGADPHNAEAVLVEQITGWLTSHGLPLDPASLAALQVFAREPLALTVRLDPPGALRPDTLGLFAAGDRSAALGLSLSTQ